MKKLTIRQQINRIEKYLKSATPEEISQGLSWYKEARALCESLSKRHNVSVRQVAEIISVLSPQKKWATNKKEVICVFSEVFEGIKPPFKYFATKSQLNDCKRIIKGEFSIPYRRIKTFSFADNIAKENSTEITIDRHALRVAYNDKTAKIDKVSPLQYREAREAYNRVAEIYGLKGYEVQAITWVVYKRIVNR